MPIQREHVQVRRNPKESDWCYGWGFKGELWSTIRSRIDPNFVQLAALFLCVPAQLLISQVDSLWKHLQRLCESYYICRAILANLLSGSIWAAQRQTELMRSASWLDSGLTSGAFQLREKMREMWGKTFFRESWLRVESWKSWCKRLLNLKMRDIMVSHWFELLQVDGTFDVQLDPLGLMDPLGECPAVEVFKFRDKDGYFGQVLA